MKKRIVRLTALALAVLCSLGGVASAQRRRTNRRPSTPRTRFAPLTAEQKAAVADILEKANALEVTYNYRPEKYADDAFDVSSKSGKAEDALPEGMMKYLLLDMWSAWRAAAFMYGTCMPSMKGSWHRFVEADIREAQVTGRKTDTTDPIPEIVREYRLQNMSPCQAQRVLFNNARIITMRARAVLDASPTARGAQPSGRADNDAPPDQADAAADTGGEWTFPKAGMQGHYNEEAKVVIYDLGDAIFAGHLKLDTNQGPLAVVLVVFGVPVPRNEMSDGDLALVAASKVASLPERVADTVMGRADTDEYRFRTTSGKVIGVSIAYDRKTAIVRSLPSQ
jgi:hypothetical protein